MRLTTSGVMGFAFFLLFSVSGCGGEGERGGCGNGKIDETEEVDDEGNPVYGGV